MDNWDYNYIVRKIGRNYIMLPVGATGKNYAIKLNEPAAVFFEILKNEKDINKSVELFSKKYEIQFEIAKAMINKMLYKFKAMEAK